MAEECCRGRLVSVTEGGYDLQALAASLDAIIEAHAAAAVSARVSGPASGSQLPNAASAALADVRPIHAPFWTL